MALTFDDGPREPYTSQVLDILRDFGVHATFFLVGENVERHPGLVRRMLREGHGIGNHSFTHRSLPTLGASAAFDEIARTDWAIRAATGVRPHLLRPPYGAMSSTLRGPAGVASRAGHLLVMWDVEVRDWSSSTSALRVATQTIRRVRPGSIVLLHDGGGDRSRTVAATRWMIGYLSREGFDFATVPELLAQSGR